MTQTSEKRRHRRLAVHLPVTLISSTDEVNMMTEDISVSGLFVRTDNPAPLRRLVKLQMTMPDTNDEVEMLAMVVYTVSPEQSVRFNKTPGMGLNLYGLTANARGQWHEFVERTIELHDQARLQDMPDLKGLIEPIRRRFPRFEAGFRVRIETVKSLYDVAARNIGAGGALLATSESLPGGTDIKLIIVHPEDGSEHLINGQVVRSLKSPDGHEGLGVCFEELDKNERASFMKFIESGMSVMDIETNIIIDDQDDLLE